MLSVVMLSSTSNNKKQFQSLEHQTSMETRKDRMAHEYVPKLHDYVKWHHGKHIHDGWVYYAGDEHISIELGVKEKNLCELTKHNKHKKDHTLLVCPKLFWHELEYVKCRKNFYDCES